MPILSTEEVNRIVGNNVKTQREKKGLSFQELAALLDLTPGYIALIERGRRPLNSKQLSELARVFEISMDDLLPNSNT